MVVIKKTCKRKMCFNVFKFESVREPFICTQIAFSISSICYACGGGNGEEGGGNRYIFLRAFGAHSFSF